MKWKSETIATLRWMGVIIVMGTILAGGCAYWLWFRSDELLRGGIVGHFEKTAPELSVQLRGARFDGHKRLFLTDLSIGPRETKYPVARIPEAVVTVDRNRFVQHQDVVIERLQFRKPELVAVRLSNGRWNLQDLKPPNVTGTSTTPDIEISDATIHLLVQHEPGEAPERFKAQKANLQLTPSARQQFDVKGTAEIEGFGHVDFGGQWNAESGAWRCSTRIEGVSIGNDLLELAVSAVPQVETKLADLDRRLHDMRVAATGAAGVRPPRYAFATDPGVRSDVLTPQIPLPVRQLGGRLDVLVQAELSERGATPRMSALIDIRDGSLETTSLPFPVNGVSGQLQWNEGELLVRSLTAGNGTARMTLNHRDLMPPGGADGKRIRVLDFDIRSLVLDRRLRQILPASWHKGFDQIRPDGIVDVKGTLLPPVDGKVSTRDVVVTARGCTANHIKFPYPIHAIHGFVRQRGSEPILDVELAGKAGEQTVNLTGLIRNPGPAAASDFRITTKLLPIDDTLRKACDENGRRVLNSLGIRGLGNVVLDLHRPQGVGRKHEPRLKATVQNTSIRFHGFPYPIKGITGEVQFEPTTKSWTFRNLQGRSGDAGKTQIRCSGAFDGRSKPGHLALKFGVAEAEFDRALYDALGGHLKKVWHELNPQAGNFDMTMNLDWTAESGNPVEIRIPSMHVQHGRMRSHAFPWQLDNVDAELSYGKKTGLKLNGTPAPESTVPVCETEIRKFTAQHGSAKINGQGAFRSKPVGETDEGDHAWEFRVQPVHAQLVRVDESLIKALPTALANAMRALNPSAPIEIEEGTFVFAHNGNDADPVTAAWSTVTRVSGGRLNAGLTLDNVNGRVSATGSWNGVDLKNNGQIRLDSVAVAGTKLLNVRGPWSATSDYVVVGSPRLLANGSRTDPNSVPVSDRLSARTYGGNVTLDARAEFRPGTPYKLLMSINDLRLEEFAQQRMPNHRNISGRVHGWAWLRGHGEVDNSINGAGQLQISPAALYELPVMFQIFNSLNTLNFNADNTAFEYVNLAFNVGKGIVQLDPVDLVGNAISLRGKGAIGFNGNAKLDFYYTTGRNPGIFSALTQMVNEATRGGIRVRGHISNPRAQVSSDLDESFKSLFGPFGGNETRPAMPRLLPPQLTAPLGF